MRKVNLIMLALFVVLLLAAPLASGQGGTIEQQISALQNQQIQAQLKNDISFFEKHYADDATIIHSDGTVWTKAQEIENMKSGTLKYESIEPRERMIHVYGNTAVVTLLISFKGVVTATLYGRDVRRTQVWVKQKGTWKTVAYQVTPVPPANK